MTSAIWTIFCGFALIVNTCSGQQKVSRYFTDSKPGNTLHPFCTSGYSQSPVNITKNQVLNYENGLIDFTSYNETVSAEFKKDAHGIVVKVDESQDVGLIVNNVTEYRLHSIHFHVGCTEHYFDGKSYNLEMHAVHYNKYWGDIMIVKDVKAGLSVVGVLFDISETENEALNILLDMIHLNSTNRGIDKKTLRYQDLLPEDTKFAYQYNGSLTTVPCSESVLWNVINQTNYVTSRQLEEFRKLQTDAPNCRKIQPLNHRQIYYVKAIITDGASISQPQQLLYAILIFISLCYYWSDGVNRLSCTTNHLFGVSTKSWL